MLQHREVALQSGRIVGQCGAPGHTSLEGADTPAEMTHDKGVHQGAWRRDPQPPQEAMSCELGPQDCRGVVDRLKHAGVAHEQGAQLIRAARDLSALPRAWRRRSIECRQVARKGILVEA